MCAESGERVEAANLIPLPTAVHKFHQLLKDLETACKKCESRGSAMALFKAKKDAKELAKLSQELSQCALFLNLEISVGVAKAQKEPQLVDAQLDRMWLRMKQLIEAEREWSCVERRELGLNLRELTGQDLAQAEKLIPELGGSEEEKKTAAKVLQDLKKENAEKLNAQNKCKLV